MQNKWSIELSPRALRLMHKLDPTVRRKIQKFIDRLLDYPSPRSTGTALTGLYERF